ncbi:Protein argonaute 4 -like protein [Gossypium arboreum]|uniref:Protein argonaute 4-like protein n=1 Tax=Gossypium arboreum TaxID=29729 RepID=A0A0B0NIX3_GOSAR|nr:Protein argonaute 4 -like protein [Gossypium arboreum]
MYQRSTTTIFVLHSWGQFIKIRDASETSSSHGEMYAPGGLTNNSQDCYWGNPFLMGL